MKKQKKKKTKKYDIYIDNILLFCHFKHQNIRPLSLNFRIYHLSINLFYLLIKRRQLQMYKFEKN